MDINLNSIRDEMYSSGAFWKHDGHPDRPYAELTSGLISDFFYNGSKVIERPWLLEKAVRHVLERAAPSLSIKPDVIVGPAVGAIPLAYEVARQYDYPTRAWFAEKTGTGKEMGIKRFDNDGSIVDILLTEDVITTGESTLETIRAVKRHIPEARIEPMILCLVNRSGKMLLRETNYQIVSVFDVEAKAWERGENPYTPDGKELVEPMRPKSNWGALTYKY